MRNVAVGNDDCREAPVAVVTACSVLVLFIAVIVFVTATSGYLDAGIAGKCRVSWLEIIALSWYCWLKAKKGMSATITYHESQGNRRSTSNSNAYHRRSIG